MYFELKVSKVENGYIAEFWEDEAEGGTKTQYVFEENDSEHGQIECFKRLLYYITEHFGMIGSKHDKKRIRIEIGGEDE